jgi:putative oxidoreductase
MSITVSTAAEKFHRHYAHLLGYLQHPLIFLLRLYWGYDFFQTGMGKLNNLERTTEFFASLNIPFPAFQAVLVGNIEMIGGILLIAGFGARYVTLPLIGIMVTAYATDDREALMNIFSDPGSFVAATPFQHLLALVITLVFGPGAISVDSVFSYLRKKGRQINRN